MRKRIIAAGIILIALAFTEVQGQLNYRDGYIVTRENDTITGKIKDGGSLKNTRVCLFKAEGTEEIRKYYPQELLAYRFDGGKYYESHQVSNGYDSVTGFLELLIKGDVNLYYFYRNTYPLYYMKAEDGIITGLRNQELPLNDPRYEQFSREYPIGWDAYVYGTNSFKDTLFKYFGDQVEVLNNLHLVEYTHQSLMNITKDYLKLSCPETICIDYEKDLFRNPPAFGLYGGLQFSQIYFVLYKVDSYTVPSLSLGFFYNIPLPVFTERLSFQLELNANRINYRDRFINQTSDYDDLTMSSTTIGIPFSMHYDFGISRLRPSIGAGKEVAFVVNSEAAYKTQRYDSDGILSYGEVNYILHKIQRGGWFFDVGLDYELSPGISLYTSFRIKTFTNLIITDPNVNRLTFNSAEVFDRTTKFTTTAGALRVGVNF